MKKKLANENQVGNKISRSKRRLDIPRAQRHALATRGGLCKTSIEAVAYETRSPFLYVEVISQKTPELNTTAKL